MTGRGAALAILAWAGLLAALAVLLPAMGDDDAVSLSQLPAAVAGTLVLAALAFALRDPATLRASDVSLGAPAVAVGLVLVIAGAAIGLWLVLAAVPLVAAGAVALYLEVRG